MEVRSESVGGGYGGYAGNYGNGIVDLIALMAVFRNGLWNGDYQGADCTLNSIQTQLGDIKGKIGESDYNTLNSVLNQTIGLMSEINAGRFENLNTLFNQTMHLESEFQAVGDRICGVEKDILTNRYELGHGIQRMGYESQINTLNQTIAIKDQLTAMQAAAAACCCETKGLIQQTAFDTQLRDLSNKADTDKQLAELKCGQGAILAKIEESRLLDENARLKDKVEALRERNDRNFLSAEIASAANKNIASTYGHWWADRAFNGETYPAPAYPSGPYV